MLPNVVPGWLWRLRFLRGYVARFRSTAGPHTAVIDVSYCSYVLTNARLHRYLKWIPTGV